MVYLPKLSYFFCHTPVHILRSVFWRLDSIVSDFVWAGRPPRVARRTLYLPLSGGGLALPNLLIYYWTAVLVTARWWFSQPRQNPAVTLEAAILGSYAALSNLVFRGCKAHPGVTVPMKTTFRVWQCSRAAHRDPLEVSPHTPVWGNPLLPHLNTIPDPAAWAMRGIVTLKQVMPGGKILTFLELRQAFNLPRSFQFRYWQLRHALTAQFPGPITLNSDSIERLLTSELLLKPLSTIYMYLTVAYDTDTSHVLAKWREDIPNLDEDIWEECVSTFISSMIASRDRFVQLKFLHRAYYTPQRLASINPSLSPLCTRCSTEQGSFFHMVWTCNKICPYWRGVTDVLTEVCGATLTLDPLVFLLSYLGDVEGDRYTKLCLTFALYYARREILLRWKGTDIPTVASWRSAINKVLPLYKITYKSRNCPAKFEKIWSHWSDA